MLKQRLRESGSSDSNDFTLHWIPKILFPSYTHVHCSASSSLPQAIAIVILIGLYHHGEHVDPHLRRAAVQLCLRGEADVVRQEVAKLHQEVCVRPGQCQ